jgi:hypothetical protein
MYARMGFAEGRPRFAAVACVAMLLSLLLLLLLLQLQQQQLLLLLLLLLLSYLDLTHVPQGGLMSLAALRTFSSAK